MSDIDVVAKAIALTAKQGFIETTYLAAGLIDHTWFLTRAIISKKTWSSKKAIDIIQKQNHQNENITERKQITPILRTSIAKRANPRKLRYGGSCLEKGAVLVMWDSMVHGIDGKKMSKMTLLKWDASLDPLLPIGSGSICSHSLATFRAPLSYFYEPMMLKSRGHGLLPVLYFN